ncbi:hypothetical protein CEXT_97211 [Caerostris extrusa]|uniref:Uncharacterized protein n=1 Tax=Caerostris extrusa TaxID=172846 RepID=A0AAV4NBG3_CAEEX|nr:hypothetical protein CEXT_97211 [Caerostris extrusa]
MIAFWDGTPGSCSPFRRESVGWCENKDKSKSETTAVSLSCQVRADCCRKTSFTLFGKVKPINQFGKGKRTVKWLESEVRERFSVCRLEVVENSSVFKKKSFKQSSVLFHRNKMVCE